MAAHSAAAFGIASHVAGTSLSEYYSFFQWVVRVDNDLAGYGYTKYIQLPSQQFVHVSLKYIRQHLGLSRSNARAS